MEKEVIDQYIVYLEKNGKIKNVQKVSEIHRKNIGTLLEECNEKKGYKSVELLIGRELEIASIKVDERECYISRIKGLIDNIYNLDYEVSSLRSSAEDIFEVIKKEVDTNE